MAEEPTNADNHVLDGRLLAYLAFDWAEEVDLEGASRLGPAAVRALATRRPRTPTTFAYKPAPLRFALEPVSLCLPPIGDVSPTAEATVFDFGAVSVSMQVRFRLAANDLLVLSRGLADPATARRVVSAAVEMVTPLHRKLLPALERPQWDTELWEEYFVFAFPPCQQLEPVRLLSERAGWLATLIRLEDEPLSDEEIREALRVSLRYGQRDLIVADWAAAALVDEEPASDETLQTVEFANLQLLEYRHIDDRLDRSLGRAYRLTREPSRPLLRLVRSQDAPLQVLGELKVEAYSLFERTGNTLKLVGDPYLARVYGLLAARFHLREWERSIQRKLDVIESVYRVISDRAAALRGEFLELIVIGLILLEVLLAIFRR